MRVTQLMVSRQFNQNLQKNNTTIDTLRQQISSGKLYEKISDNPLAALKGLSYHSSQVQIEQYQQNAQDGTEFLSAADDTLSNINDVMQRIREITVQTGNDTYNDTDKKNMATELHSLKEQLGSLANTTFNGHYLFSGMDQDTPPYKNGQLQNISSSDTNWDVAKGVSVNVSISANSVFGFKVNNMDLFQTIDNLAQSLENGQNPGDFLNIIDKQIDNINTQQTVVGVNHNLLELAANQLDQANLLNQKMTSNTEDTDIAKAYTELTAQQATLNATLTMGAKVNQLTLADFLR
jgi:flagellar hook-associated protein 3 FlgL